MGLSQYLAQEFLDYNPVTGLLIWKHRSRFFFKTYRSYKCWNAKYANKSACNTLRPDGYLSGNVLGKTYLTHRIIWMWLYGYWPEEIDHKDGNKSNNCLKNLRDVSHAENQKNRALPVNNKSGYIGIAWVSHASKWAAQIRINKKSKHLGYFDDLHEAISARNTANNDFNFYPNHGRN